MEKTKKGLRKCKYDDDECEVGNGKGYCLDEDYGVSGVCPYEEGGEEG